MSTLVEQETLGRRRNSSSVKPGSLPLSSCIAAPSTQIQMHSFSISWASSVLDIYVLAEINILNVLMLRGIVVGVVVVFYTMSSCPAPQIDHPPPLKFLPPN